MLDDDEPAQAGQKEESKYYCKRKAHLLWQRLEGVVRGSLRSEKQKEQPLKVIPSPQEGPCLCWHRHPSGPSPNHNYKSCPSCQAGCTTAEPM
eukprot:1158028-Pelagomonas_calceolata.AAC.9